MTAMAMAMDVTLTSEQRAAMYGLLGRLLDREVTAGQWEEMKESGFLAALLEVDEESPAPIDDLAVELARLFIGPGPAAPPYGSIYRDDDRFAGELIGETTGEVRRFMEHYGLKPTEEGRIPDHVSVLFAFMESVIEAEHGAEGDESEEAARVARRFFGQYLAPWIDRFLARLSAQDPHPFYRGVGLLTEQFIIRERLLLAA